MRHLLLAAATLVLAGAAAAATAAPLCKLAPGATRLPASARHGLIRHLQQYPDLGLATAAQSAAAARLLARTELATRAWPTPAAARRAGFDTRTVAREPGDTTVHWLHAEHRRWSHDARDLDPARPESLIYANAPGRPLVLVGVMFSVRRGRVGATPGGPLTRWHRHTVCAAGSHRGLKPLPDGSCPRGATLREGSEMLHVWFTGDLRSAFAVHAPTPELCAAGLLPGADCRAGRVGSGM